jgi:hypothetical protein
LSSPIFSFFFWPQENPTGPRLVKNWVSMKTMMLCGITIPKPTVVAAVDSCHRHVERKGRIKMRKSKMMMMGGPFTVFLFCETREFKKRMTLRIIGCVSRVSHSLLISCYWSSKLIPSNDLCSGIDSSPYCSSRSYYGNWTGSGYGRSRYWPARRASSDTT